MTKDRLSEMRQEVLMLTRERNWEQFHTPKNLAMDLVHEAAEVLEHFIWEDNETIRRDKKRLKEVRKEMADVLHSLMLLADCLEIDLVESFWEKLEELKKRYPADAIYGTSGYTFKYSQRKKK